jgi:hypothetical protein
VSGGTLCFVNICPPRWGAPGVPIQVLGWWGLDDVAAYHACQPIRYSMTYCLN